jgi:hypothetical protein
MCVYVYMCMCEQEDKRVVHNEIQKPVMESAWPHAHNLGWEGGREDSVMLAACEAVNTAVVATCEAEDSEEQGCRVGPGGRCWRAAAPREAELEPIRASPARARAHRKVGVLQRLHGRGPAVGVPGAQLRHEVDGLGAGVGNDLGQRRGRELREAARFGPRGRRAGPLMLPNNAGPALRHPQPAHRCW